MEDANEFEFQRVHRIGKRRSSYGKPRQIIARFLKYPDREAIMSNARKLKGKDFGISPDLPKEIIDRRKKKMQQFKKAKEDGKPAYFSRGNGQAIHRRCSSIDLFVGSNNQAMYNVVSLFFSKF